MINASELRIYNFIGCKVSNDSGVYQVEGIDGWKRVFKSESDEKKYNKFRFDIDTKSKPVEFHDERLIRIVGGARDGEQYIESKLMGIKITKEWLIKLGFKKKDIFDLGISYTLIIDKESEIQITFYKNKYWLGEYELKIKYIHQLQNAYFFLTGKEL